MIAIRETTVHRDPDESSERVPSATVGDTPLDVARGQLGAPYVWGGLR